ncbi:MAG: hypothetical protein U1E39_15230 [Planctomycetota bacterium]
MSDASPSEPSRASAEGLAALPGPRRLVLGAFLTLLLAFYGAAQLQLIVTAGGGSLPGPDAVLVRYHGDPLKSRLHLALDPARAETDPRRMYTFLGETEDDRVAAHRLLLGWVEAGAPRARWAEVAPVLTGAKTCGGCHARGVDEGGLARVKADLPFETYEDVLPSTARGAGMPLAELTTTTHNHLFGFAVLAALVGWVFTGTRWRGPVAVLLPLTAFAGIVLDVGGWWLTRSFGSPFQWSVMLGGALFGAGVMGMVVLSLDEVACGGALARLLRPVLAAMRLARRDA